VSARPEGETDRHRATHARARAIVCSIALLAAAVRCMGADLWGGSLDLTSDYFVRGISRSDDHAALQLDLHYLNSSGFVAGFFASNTQIDPGEPRDGELSAFLGYAWSAGDDWQGKVRGSHYSYPWNQVGSKYNYDEVDVEVGYRGWLQVVLAYSPDSPRYIAYRGLVAVAAESAEVNLRRSLVGNLSASAGVGYYYIEGADATGYAYWGVGAAYDLAPVSLSLSYVGASTAANSLFYNAAVGGRCFGTVIWRF
jgi:uncharacterized protein (TIGR02001 family)